MERVDIREVPTPAERSAEAFEGNEGTLVVATMVRGGDAVIEDGIDEKSDSDQLERSPRVSLSRDSRGADSVGGPREGVSESDEPGGGVEISDGLLMSRTSASGGVLETGGGEKISSSTPFNGASVLYDL